MKGLTPDDLLPLDDFTTRRRELFESHTRYVDRYRRVRIGPRLTLLFENRQTLWFRVQEVLRIARLTEPSWVRRELEVYNRLLPERDRLQAALILDVDPAAPLESELAVWRDLRGDELRLLVGTLTYPANLYTCRPEDRCVGAAHWVQFVLDTAGRQALADRRRPVYFAVTLPNYRHDSAPLSEDVRRSLLDDLTLSDRDDPSPV
jgi:hypothetical protein